MEETKNKPTVELIGHDGNVFSVIGRVDSALRAAGQRDQAKEFREKAFAAESYDAVLQLAMKYCEVE